MMNPEEVKIALDYFVRRKQMNLDDIPQQRENVAIQALEKQMPRKPKMITGLSGTEYGVCPVCSSVTIFKNCANCGQAIDRSGRASTKMTITKETKRVVLDDLEMIKAVLEAE